MKECFKLFCKMLLTIFLLCLLSGKVYTEDVIDDGTCSGFKCDDNTCKQNSSVCEDGCLQYPKYICANGGSYCEDNSDQGSMCSNDNCRRDRFIDDSYNYYSVLVHANIRKAVKNDNFGYCSFHSCPLIEIGFNTTLRDDKSINTGDFITLELSEKTCKNLCLLTTSGEIYSYSNDKYLFSLLPDYHNSHIGNFGYCFRACEIFNINEPLLKYPRLAGNALVYNLPSIFAIGCNGCDALMCKNEEKCNYGSNPDGFEDYFTSCSLSAAPTAKTYIMGHQIIGKFIYQRPTSVCSIPKCRNLREFSWLPMNEANENSIVEDFLNNKATAIIHSPNSNNLCYALTIQTIDETHNVYNNYYEDQWKPYDFFLFTLCTNNSCYVHGYASQLSFVAKETSSMIFRKTGNNKSLIKDLPKIKALSCDLSNKTKSKFCDVVNADFSKITCDNNVRNGTASVLIYNNSAPMPQYPIYALTPISICDYECENLRNYTFVSKQETDLTNEFDQNTYEAHIGIYLHRRFNAWNFSKNLCPTFCVLTGENDTYINENNDYAFSMIPYCNLTTGDCGMYGFCEEPCNLVHRETANRFPNFTREDLVYQLPKIKAVDCNSCADLGRCRLTNYTFPTTTVTTLTNIPFASTQSPTVPENLTKSIEILKNFTKKAYINYAVYADFYTEFTGFFTYYTNTSRKNYAFDSLIDASLMVYNFHKNCTTENGPINLIICDAFFNETELFSIVLKENNDDYLKTITKMGFYNKNEHILNSTFIEAFLKRLKKQTDGFEKILIGWDYDSRPWVFFANILLRPIALHIVSYGGYFRCFNLNGQQQAIKDDINDIVYDVLTILNNLKDKINNNYWRFVHTVATKKIDLMGTQSNRKIAKSLERDLSNRYCEISFLIMIFNFVGQGNDFAMYPTTIGIERNIANRNYSIYSVRPRRGKGYFIFHRYDSSNIELRCQNKYEYANLLQVNSEVSQAGLKCKDNTAQECVDAIKTIMLKYLDAPWKLISMMAIRAHVGFEQTRFIRIYDYLYGQEEDGFAFGIMFWNHMDHTCLTPIDL